MSEIITVNESVKYIIYEPNSLGCTVGAGDIFK